MRRLESEVIGGIFWMAVGIFFGLGAIKLNVGTLNKPGPGFLPLIMALILVFFSLFILVKGAIRPLRPVSQIPWKRHALMTASVLFVYGLALDFMGFLPSIFILMFILFGLLIKGKNKWSIVLLYSATTALVAWLTFSVLLKLPFPYPYLMAIWR